MQHDYYVDGPAVEYGWSKRRALVTASTRWKHIPEIQEWVRKMLWRSDFP